ncbi:MAG TPA: 6-bladed beta-propeller [Longimicrobiaceae bacterium]|nr:6-bladed beta-propeller [Longimicrobiaceae bacterium]
MTYSHPRPLALVPLAALALAASACGRDGGAAAGRWEGTVDTLPGGAVRVQNPEHGIWKAGEGWMLVEELRIGSAEVDGPELFGQVAALTVDPLGRIYVLDDQAKEVRVFDARGKHVRSFGRKGGGPGEFESPGSLDWDPQGHLWIVDQSNARFSVFDTAGAFVTSHRRRGGFSMVPWPGGLDAQGRVYDAAMLPGGTLFRTGLVRLDEQFEPADTFRTPEYEQAAFFYKDEKGTTRMSAAVPFSPAQTSRLDREGHLWIGTTDRYRLHRITIAGDTTRIVERPFTPVAVSSNEKDEAVKNLKWFTDQGGKIDPSRIPGKKPAFTGFQVDEEGYLWVWPAVAEGEEGSVIDVFDPEGRYLGQIRSEAKIGARGRFVVRGDRLYTVVTDELEVPYVVRYRIQGRTPAGA